MGFVARTACVLLSLPLPFAVARGCGAYPPPALEDAPAPPVTRTWAVTADDAGANTCAQMTTDDVMWQLLDAEHAGRVLRFVGCVEVVP